MASFVGNDSSAAIRGPASPGVAQLRPVKRWTGRRRASRWSVNEDSLFRPDRGRGVWVAAPPSIPTEDASGQSFGSWCASVLTPAPEIYFCAAIGWLGFGAGFLRL